MMVKKVMKILMLIDTQIEFITGSLGNKECEDTVPEIVKAIEEGGYDVVYATKDTHGEDYLATQEGRRLPVIHGQKGTEGYKIHPDIIAALERAGIPVIFVTKNTFGSIELGERLCREYGECDEVTVDFAGYCTSICVINNEAIVKAFLPEAQIRTIAKACACVSKETHEAALTVMKTMQVDII